MNFNPRSFVVSTLRFLPAAFVAGIILGHAHLQAAPIPVQSYAKDDAGVTCRMNPGLLRVEPVGDRTFHVVYTPADSLPDHPLFAVEKQPAPGPFQVHDENTSGILITTAQGGVRIDRATGALSFLDAAGKSFLSETADGGKTLTPATVAGVSTNTVDQKFILDPQEALFGLGQHPGGVMNWVGNTVHLQQKNMDIAVPVLVSSKGYGVFWNNPAVTNVKISKADDPAPTVEWNSEAGTGLNYYVFCGPELTQVIAAYRELTGAAPMFPRWAWGFWQCKEHYNTQQELLDVAAKYRQMHVPIDAIIQDWFYWNPYPWGSHQFDAKRYPDASALTKALHREAVHIIISVWARFEPGSTNVAALQQAGDLLGSPDPNAAKKSQYYDPFKPAARELYWDQVNREIFSHGFDGFWLDASEAELNMKWGEFRNYKTAAGPGVEVYNAFPLMHTSSVYHGMRAADPAKRVFILTRSAYPGQQRNAAVSWSGDIQGTWDVFRQQIPNGINFTLSGIPYWNTDTGGFFIKQAPTDPDYAELFTRWFQFSAFCPMFRVHGTNHPKEMWQFPPATEKILIDYDKLRYHLLPYIYSVAWQVTSHNDSMMRGLVLDFRNDAKVYNIPDQYLFGPAIMVSPVTQKGAQARQVYLPAGTSWTDFWTGQSSPGGQAVDATAPIQTLPLYLRAGSILPYGPEVQSSAEAADPLELRVYRGADGAFTLYEDEGDNYNYEKGAYATIPITWSEARQTLTLGARQGTFPGMLPKRTFRIVWVAPNHGAGLDTTPKADAEISHDGHEIAVPAPR